MKINLVSWAHDFARERFGNAADAPRFAVDATVGNGHDALFLARLVGAHGRVAGFDVQTAAIEATRERLRAHGAEGVVELHPCGHERMADELGEAWLGRTHAVFFNLGYLPKSDRGVTTRAETTLPALDAAWTLLAPGGFISLTIYTRHPGGFDESAQVSAWLEKMRSRAEILTLGTHNPAEPWWAGVTKISPRGRSVFGENARAGAR
ncbi:MAG: class I SAM-dependent methyltransferase [Candidatus Spyradosoma sp.]